MLFYFFIFAPQLDLFKILSETNGYKNNIFKCLQ